MSNKHTNKGKSENDIFEAGFKAGISLMALTLANYDDPKKFLTIVANDDEKLNTLSKQLYSEFVRLYKSSKGKKEE